MDVYKFCTMSLIHFRQCLQVIKMQDFIQRLKSWSYTPYLAMAYQAYRSKNYTLIFDLHLPQRSSDIYAFRQFIAQELLKEKVKQFWHPASVVVRPSNAMLEKQLLIGQVLCPSYTVRYVLIFCYSAKDIQKISNVQADANSYKKLRLTFSFNIYLQMKSWLTCLIIWRAFDAK